VITFIKAPARVPDTRPHACPSVTTLREGSEESMLEFLREMWAFLRIRKKFWLLPLLIVMGLLGVLIFLTEGSVIAPFIYALF
jgi:hypothetical protein